jgi:hypothetical protein
MHAMNTANLQLQGLCVAVACLLQALKAKGLLTETEVEQMLADAERSAAHVGETMRTANSEAVTFPIRFLRAVNTDEAPGAPDFQRIARQVGADLDRSRTGAVAEGEGLELARRTLVERDA